MARTPQKSSGHMAIHPLEEKSMSTSNPRRVRAAQSVLFASLLSLVAVAPAFAGECPADKVGANPLTGAATAPVGVMEKELSSIDLGKETVVLTIADIVNDKKPDTIMPMM